MQHCLAKLLPNTVSRLNRDLLPHNCARQRLETFAAELQGVAFVASDDRSEHRVVLGEASLSFVPVIRSHFGASTCRACFDYLRKFRRALPAPGLNRRQRDVLKLTVGLYGAKQ